MHTLPPQLLQAERARTVLAETLNVELSQFGIRTLILEPGAFRTPALQNVKLSRPEPIADYDPLASMINKTLANMPPLMGDPAKAMELLVDVVRGEGKAEGKGWPLYLPMGALTEEAIRSKTGKVLGVLDDWAEIIRELEFDK